MGVHYIQENMVNWSIHAKPRQLSSQLKQKNGADKEENQKRVTEINLVTPVDEGYWEAEIDSEG